MKQVYENSSKMAHEPKLLNSLLLFVIISIPLEGILADLTGREIHTPTLYLMSLIFVVALPYFPKIFLYYLPNAPGLLMLISVFLWSFLLWFLNPLHESWGEIQTLFLSFIFTLTFFYMARIPKYRRRAVIAFMLGWAALIILSLLRIDSYQPIIYQSGVVRYETIVGLQCNKHAAYVGCGLVMSLVLLLEGKYTKKQLLLLLLIVGLGSKAFLMGNSQGAFFTLLATISIILLRTRRLGLQFQSRNTRRFPRFVLYISTIVLALFVSTSGQYLFNSAIGRSRNVVYEHEYSMRDALAFAAIPVIATHPLGAGQGNSMRYIAEQVGSFYDKDVHNEYLRIFMDAGWIGGIIFLLALYKIITYAKNNSATLYDKALFIGLIFNLINAIVSHNFSYKTTWFFLAMCAFMPSKKSVPTQDNNMRSSLRTRHL